MRWKFLLPALAIIFLITLFNILLLDILLKKSLVASGEMIFGAKVDVGSLKTKFRNLSVGISNLQVADKNDPWKNLFEISDIRFAVKPVPLLSKKFIIEEMSVEGIKTGTPRKTSGALAPKKVVQIEKKKKKQGLTSELYGKLKKKAESEIASLPALSKIKSYEKEIKEISIDKVVKFDELGSVKEMDALKESYSQKYSHYETKLSDLKLSPQLAAAESALQMARQIKIQDAKDIENAKQVINELNRSKQELEKSYLEIMQISDSISVDFGSEKNLLGRLNELKEKDYRAFADKLKLPPVSFGNISEAIFGRVWIERVNNVMYYIHLARKYMPARKKEEKVVRKRLRGTDVIFPKKGTSPDFLIKKISLSGAFGQEEPLGFIGEVTDITSEPVLLGRPMLVDIKGYKGKKKIEISAKLDHTQSTPYDSLNISYIGLESKSLGLPSSDYLPSFEKSNSRISAKFVKDGDIIDCGLNLTMDEVSARAPEDDEVKEIVKNLWSGMDAINIDARVLGPSDNLKVSVNSNIEKIFSKRLKALFGEKIAEFHKKIRAEIVRLTNEKKNEVMKEFNSKKESVQKQYIDKQKEVRSRIDESKAKVEEIENRIKEYVEIEKKKAEEELKKKIGEKLPGKLPEVFRK